MSIIEKLKVAAAELEHIKLSPDESMWLVSHVRTQANTLASTQAEFELCRATVSEANKRIAELEEKWQDHHALHAHCKRTLTDGDIANLFGERMTEVVNSLTSEQSAHLATRRALVRCMDRLAEAAEALESEKPEERHAEYQNITFLFGDLWDVATAARAEVAKADACKKNDPVFLTNPEPRADAQKGTK